VWKKVVDTIEGREYPRTEEVGCPLCGRIHGPRALRVRFGMVAMVAECSQCRLAYQSPRPSQAASDAYMNMRWGSSDTYVADVEQQRCRARNQLSYITGVCGKPGKLLDFGAGVGTFIRVALDSGWEATGIERSIVARERASVENGVHLVDELTTKDQYDVITLIDVIEHLRQPLEVLVALREVLRPGGYLFVETGNWESYVRLALGDSYGLYLFDHQFYFSPPSLERLLAKCGFCSFTLLNSAEPLPGWSQLARPFRLWPPRSAYSSVKRLVRAWCAFRRANEQWPSHGRLHLAVVTVQAPGPPSRVGS